MSAIRLTVTNTKQVANALKKRAGAFPRVASNTVNTGARYIDRQYRKNLQQKFIIRNNYTMRAIKIFPSSPVRSSGKFRSVKDIKSILIIRQMKGGKTHYLQEQEEGAAKRGKEISKGKVAIPLTTSRTSQSIRKPIAGRYRLYSQLFETPMAGNKGFGVNDKFTDAQRWAIANKYITGTKMFFLHMDGRLNIYAKKSGKIRKVRDLSKSTIRIRPRHLLRKAFSKLTPNMMDVIFRREAARFIRD